MHIQILGTGCPKCTKLAKLADQAATELGLDYNLEKVTDVTKIVEFGVMATPGLAVDGNVLVAGKVPKQDKIKDLLQQAASGQ